MHERYSGMIKLEKVKGIQRQKQIVVTSLFQPVKFHNPYMEKQFSGDIKIESVKEPTDVKFEVSTSSGDVNLFDKYQ